MTGITAIRPAATVVVVREASTGPEVLLLERTHKAVFMPGAFVFPGGAVDRDDTHIVASHLTGMDEVAANRLLGIDRGGLDYMVTAIRECFEEAGLLLACDAAEASALQRARQALLAGELTFAEFCREYELMLRADRLAYLSRWVTPPGPPRRFDTRFFVAEAPPGQRAVPDGSETVGHLWIQPAQAVARYRSGRLPLGLPTLHTLETLASYDSVNELLMYARKPRKVRATRPWPARGRDGLRVLHDKEPAYAEVVKLDPDGRGTASYEILPGVVTQLGPGVQRLTAPNSGYMTGPGTNTYLVGEGDDLCVIDPGPADAEHVARILEASGGRIRSILVTHTHMDHSPAAEPLREATGAEVLGMPAPPHKGQDERFRPDRVLRHGDRLITSAGTLRVLHTPGHASNHLCYLLDEQRLLFSGDHIMQGSTVVIGPPDGDMAAYLNSLEALQREAIDYIAPAHGFLMDRPQAAITRLLRHRRLREQKVLTALGELGPAHLDTLLPAVYQDVPKPLHKVAARSLLAHLFKLQQEGRARCDDGQWVLSSAS